MHNFLFREGASRNVGVALGLNLAMWTITAVWEYILCSTMRTVQCKKNWLHRITYFSSNWNYRRCSIIYSFVLHSAAFSMSLFGEKMTQSTRTRADKDVKRNICRLASRRSDKTLTSSNMHYFSLPFLPSRREGCPFHPSRENVLRGRSSRHFGAAKYPKKRRKAHADAG